MSQSPKTPMPPTTFALSRRDVIAGAGAALLVSATPGAASQPLGATMRERILNWRDLLDGAQREAASFAFDSRARRAWSYMWGSRRAPGLALEQMMPEQKDAALDVLATGLSDYGLETAMNVMLQQDILRDEWGKGRPDRNRERFSLSIFGEPSATEPWGWRWEGHHLTISFTLVGDEIVAHTPKAFSSEPNTVPSGPHQGLVVLPENESLGRLIFSELQGAARQEALLSNDSYGNIITRAGREGAISSREGIPLGDLPQTQIDRVRRLIDLYTTDHLATPMRAAQAARIDAQDLMAARFGFAGTNEDEESIYYRIHGETFLIEFATLFNQPLHHHTVVHDLERNFGDQAV